MKIFIAKGYLILLFKKLGSFIKRDFYIDISYKFAFIQKTLITIVPLILMFFVNKLMEGNYNESLQKYGGNYFMFAITGLCFSNYFNIALGTFKASIRRSQLTGCLEAILSSQTGTKSIILMSSVYSFITTSVHLLIAAIIIYFFGFDFSNSNFIATIVVFVISLLLFVSMGIISSSFIMKFKKGDLLGFFLGTVSTFLSGVFFPVSLFPQWLEKTSRFIPITYTIEAIRMALLKGYSVNNLHREIFILAVIAIVLFPLSLWLFTYTLNSCKKDGTLMQY